jgi:hypothetical protein
MGGAIVVQMKYTIKPTPKPSLARPQAGREAVWGVF